MSMTPDSPTAASSGGTQDTTAQQAAQVKDQAQGAAKEVAGTAKDEAAHVKDEAMGQARDLAESAKQEASSQLATQKDRLAGQSRTISDDLERISRGEKPESDMVNQAVSMLSDRARRLTEQLESKEPMDLLDDVRRFAARRPGTFLAIAAGIGLAAGRLTRGLKDADDGHNGGQQGQSPRHGQPASSNYGGTVPPPPAVAPVETGYTGADLGAGTPATEVLGTPAATDPYGTGLPGTGGRP
ncbi:hypothetical protein [Citricoccus nitrophenolicus]|uniref:hypothetical protein n=1 Tax=Citricoccus nitrophenolicus TaxID=863575 RepID=UPI0031ED7526